MKRKKFVRPSKNHEKNHNSTYKRGRPQEKDTRVLPKREYEEGALPDLIRPQKDITVTSDYSDEVIEDVFTALYDDVTKKTVSFDEAIELIKQREDIASDEEILYVGRGTFAITAYETVDNVRNQVIRKKVDFEKNSEVLDWRKSLCFDISLGANPPATTPHTLDDNAEHVAPISSNSS